MSENHSIEDVKPLELVETDNAAKRSSLPTKSGHIYGKCYDDFCKWQSEQKTKTIDEEVLLAYFNEIASKLSSATLWSRYSMLKKIILEEKKINIKKYTKLQNFIKEQHTGYTPKKANVFTCDQINEYLKNAPDEIHLPTKVGIILGVTGACRRNELYRITVQDIKILDTLCIITLPNTKGQVSRTFTIDGDHLAYIKKYINSRPADAISNKLFLNYRHNKCINQVIGIHAIGNMPKIMANYLNLPDPHLYTGHSFKRTSSFVTDT